MRNPFQKFTIGFKSVFSGISLIRRDAKILRLAIIPFCIDFIALAGVFVWGSSRLSGWVDTTLGWMFSESGGLLWNLVYWPFFLLSWIIFLGLLFFAGYVVASLVAAPFNSLLAEATLEQLGVLPTKLFNLIHWLSHSLKMLLTALAKTLLFIVFAALLFGLSFMPILGILASFGMVMVMVFDSADYSFEALGYRLRERFTFFRQNLFYFAGSAGAMGLTLLVPGLNFILLPATVVGSANLIKQIKDNAKLVDVAGG